MLRENDDRGSPGATGAASPPAHSAMWLFSLTASTARTGRAAQHPAAYGDHQGMVLNHDATPTYAEYLRHRPFSARAALRSATLSALAAAARLSGRVDASLERPRVQLIYLHHVFRDEEDGFRRLLERLGRHHSFIGHAEAVDRIRSGRIDRPFLSVSFDDGFVDNLAAASILEEFGARGCFFVCPAIVGERDPARVAAFCTQRLQFPLVSPFLDWDQLQGLAEGGHEIGAHTMTHPNLGEATADDAAWEIRESRRELMQRVGPIRHFAWPRGQWRNFTPAAYDAVFDAGFESCASAVRGCHVARATGPASKLCLRRDHVVANWPLDHVLYFLMRSSERASERDNRWPDEFSRES